VASVFSSLREVASAVQKADEVGLVHPVFSCAIEKACLAFFTQKGAILFSLVGVQENHAIAVIACNLQLRL
jgi:hypothetical protein